MDRFKDNLPICDSQLVSPVQCVSKKEGMTMAPNVNNELIPNRTITGRRVLWAKLNKAIRKDHFPFSFMDKMLNRLIDKDYFYFLGRYKWNN